MPNITYQRGLHLFAWLTGLATLVLIGAGGLVTSHGVGLAVPDWPNTYGYNMFFFPVSQWVGGIFYEHTHRLIASGVGLLTVILALWLHGRRARPLMRWGGAFLVVLAVGIVVASAARWADAVVLGVTGLAALLGSWRWPSGDGAPRWLKRLGTLAVILVIGQGILGGLRVTALKDELGIFHGTLAQLFFCLICAIVLFTSKWWQNVPLRRADVPSPVRSLLLCTTLVVLAQLAVGATMRHAHAGLAIPDFPLAYGQWWPEMDEDSVRLYNQQRLEVISVKPIQPWHIALQMTHRLVAVAILLLALLCTFQAWRKLPPGHLLQKLTIAMSLMVVAQGTLGAYTVWSNKAADIATLHVILGALLLAIGTLGSIVSFRLRSPAREETPALTTLSAFGPRPAQSGS